MPLRLDSAHFVFCLWFIVFVRRSDLVICLGMLECVFSAGGGHCSVEAWYCALLNIDEALTRIVDSDVHLFVADVVKSFGTVDRGILHRMLSCLGLPGWFRHACFRCHVQVRLRFKLSAGFCETWTRDGGIP